MIEINLLPPKERSSLAALIVPLLLLAVGLGLGTFLALDYTKQLQSAETSRNQLADTAQKQSDLQQELQILGQQGGLKGDANNLIESMRQLRPDLDPLLTELELPLPAGSEIETVTLSEDGGLSWTCSFPGLTDAGDYSVSIQNTTADRFVLIHSVTERTGKYVGVFQLRPLHERGKAGDAE